MSDLETTKENNITTENKKGFVYIDQMINPGFFLGSITEEKNISYYHGPINTEKNSKEILEKNIYSCEIIIKKENKKIKVSIKNLKKDNPNMKFYSGFYALLRHQQKYYYFVQNKSTAEFCNFKKKLGHFMKNKTKQQLNKFIKTYENNSLFNDNEIDYLAGMEKSDDKCFGFSEDLEKRLKSTDSNWKNQFSKFKASKNEPFYACLGGKPKFQSAFETLKQEMWEETGKCLKDEIDKNLKDFNLENKDQHFEIETDGLYSHFSVIDIDDDFYKKLSSKELTLSIEFSKGVFVTVEKFEDIKYNSNGISKTFNEKFYKELEFRK